MRVTMHNQPGLLKQAAIWHGQEAMRAESVAFGVIDKHGHLHAVITIDNHQAYSCDMHIATNNKKRWATRRVLEAIARYVFEHLNLIKIKTTIPHWNLRAQALVLHLGFVAEGYTKCGAHDGSDGVYFGMTRDECPWLKRGEVEPKEQQNGQQSS